MAHLKREFCSWGFAIVIACLIINFVIDGVRFSFGILFEVFTDTFGKDARTTAWVGSLMFSVLNFGGPVGSVCVRKFGCRITTILGSLVCFAGFILSAYVPNLYFLYFSLGILVGFGMSLMYVAETVIILRYFKDNRTFAVGISICGSGLGGSSFTFLLSILDDLYSWSSLMLILSGILLQTSVAGMLMRPNPIETSVPMLKGEEKFKIDKELKPAKENQHSYIPSSLEKEFCEKDKHMRNVNKDGGYSNNIQILKVTSEQNNHEMIDEYVYKSQKSKPLKDTIFKIYSEGSMDKTSQLAISDSPKLSINIRQVHAHKTCQKQENQYMSPPSSSILSIYGELLKDVKVHLLLGSQLCLSVAFMVPFTFIPMVAMDKEHSNYRAKWLLSSVNISNIACRLLSGYLADRRFVNRSYLYTLSIFVLPVAGAGYALFDNYAILMISSCAIGIGIGVMITVFPVVIVDIFGEKRVNEIFGLSIFCRGPGNLIGPPIAGYIIDVTETPSHVFCLFSGLTMMGTILTVMFVYMHMRKLKQTTYLNTEYTEGKLNHT